jgi:hypothetical protein
MRVLVACEYSGRVRSAFRALGHDAWSCDIEPAADGQSYHYREDCLAVIDRGAETINPETLPHVPWDMVIAFPPCTYLCNSGLHWNAKQPERAQKTADAARFFMAFTKVRCPFVIENPVGVMSTLYRKPDQIVQPYQFGDSAKKTTCLWMSPGLPLLVPDRIVDPGAFVINPDGRKYPQWMTTKGKHRSVTFPGIARAMAERWGGQC